jgi:arginyl-tRNA synthetase
LFALVKQLRKSPEQLGQELGEYLTTHEPRLFTCYNVIKGFLNLTVSDNVFKNYLHKQFSNENLGKSTSSGVKVMVEYSSPNT